VSTEVSDDTDRSRYEVAEDGELVGLLTYRLSGRTVDLLHAEVDPDHRGRGLAAVLVRFALEDARSRGLAVLPHCPYVAGFIAGHRDEYLDLVPGDRRAQFGLDV
jgi:predicted GNAT family acetyltransferase